MTSRRRYDLPEGIEARSIFQIATWSPFRPRGRFSFWLHIETQWIKTQLDVLSINFHQEVSITMHQSFDDHHFTPRVISPSLHGISSPTNETLTPGTFPQSRQFFMFVLCFTFCSLSCIDVESNHHQRQLCCRRKTVLNTKRFLQRSGCCVW